MALCAATMAQAQSFRWGVEAGMGVVSPTDMKSGVGFQLGVKGEMAFKSAQQGWFIDAALLFDKKNSKSDGYYEMDTRTSTAYQCSPYGITIPVNVGYKFQVAKPVSVYLAAGPYVTVGIAGSYKQTYDRYDTNGVMTSSLTADYPAYDYLNRCTAGVGCKIGAELFSHYQISAGYDWAFNSMFNNSSALKSKCRELTVSVAYIF